MRGETSQAIIVPEAQGHLEVPTITPGITINVLCYYSPRFTGPLLPYNDVLWGDDQEKYYNPFESHNELKNFGKPETNELLNRNQDKKEEIDFLYKNKDDTEDLDDELDDNHYQIFNEDPKNMKESEEKTKEELEFYENLNFNPDFKGEEESPLYPLVKPLLSFIKERL